MCMIKGKPKLFNISWETNRSVHKIFMIIDIRIYYFIDNVRRLIK